MYKNRYVHITYVYPASRSPSLWGYVHIIYFSRLTNTTQIHACHNQYNRLYIYIYIYIYVFPFPFHVDLFDVDVYRVVSATVLE